MTRKLSAGLMGAALLLAAGCGSKGETTSPAAARAPVAAAPVAPGDAAAAVPDSLQFAAKTVDGAAFPGSALAGHDAVLWFWAPGCSDCKHLAPGVVAAAKANPSVRFVGVAGLADRTAMLEAVTAMHIDGFTELADIHGTLWRRFGVTTQPAFAFLDTTGRVSLHKGGMRQAELARRAAALS